MLRISFDSGPGGSDPVLRLEGQIVGRWVTELRRVYDERPRGVDMLTVDLEDVTFIDRSGVAFFDEIYPNVILVNCSLFAAEQLKPVTERHAAVRPT
jgi:hypothetical protein